MSTSKDNKKHETLLVGILNLLVWKVGILNIRYLLFGILTWLFVNVRTRFFEVLVVWNIAFTAWNFEFRLALEFWTCENYETVEFEKTQSETSKEFWKIQVKQPSGNIQLWKRIDILWFCLSYIILNTTALQNIIWQLGFLDFWLGFLDFWQNARCQRSGKVLPIPTHANNK